MKAFWAVVALLSVSMSSAWASETQFPKTGEAMFTITIPDSWELDSDDDDVIQAQSPKENITLSIWEIDGETKVEDLANDLQDILKDYATDVKLDEEPKQIEVAGLPGIFMVGLGQDDQDGHEVGFIALVLVKGDDAAIIFFEMDGNVTPGELKKFNSIVKSIKSAE